MRKSVARDRAGEKNVRLLRRFAVVDLCMEYTARLMRENELTMGSIAQLMLRIQARGKSDIAEKENARDRAMIDEFRAQIDERNRRISEQKSLTQSLERAA